MARYAGVSERQIDRLFADHLGRSFRQQYRLLRLAHARLLLEQSVLSMTQVAVATGFNNASHFSRSFRLHYGLSPRALRGRTDTSAAGLPGDQAADSPVLSVVGEP